VQPSNYYPLLVFHKVAVHRPRVIKRDFRTLGRLLKKSGEQVIFSSLLPVTGGDIARKRWTQSVNTWLSGWCHGHNFMFFDDWMAYTAPGLLASDGIRLSQRGKRVFAQELAGLIGRALK